MNRTWWTGLLVGGAVSAVVLTAVTGLKAQNRGAASLGRVVCLDVIKIFNEYQRHKDLDEELRAAKEDMRNEAERRVGQIDSLQATLDAMSPDDPTLLRRHREMLQLQLDYKNWSDLMQAEMAREIGVWNKRTYAEVLAVVEELAQREGFDVALYKSSPELLGFDPEAIQEQIRLRKLLYSNPEVDITQTVLDALNANYRAQPRTQMLQISPTLQTVP